jgi:hypothetical protein
VNLRSVVQSFMQPATLGHKAHEFLEMLDAKLPEQPTREQFEHVLTDTLKLRRFRNLNPGLPALAEHAWIYKGEAGINCYLKQQAEIAFDAETRDRWNRDVRAKMAPILQTVVRAGKAEISTADTVQAFALEDGLPLLDEAIRDRYQAPQVVDRDVWRASVTSSLKGELAKWPKWEAKVDLSKIDELTGNLTSTFDAWLSISEAAQASWWAKVRTLTADLADQPGEVLLGTCKEAAWRLNRIPREAHLFGTIAASLVIAARVGFAVTTVPGAIMTVLALLGGWLAADLNGAVFHWNKDNYPKGRVGREFIDHHYNPRAVSEWPLRRNVDGTAKPALIGVAAAAFLPGGPLAAFLLSMLNGIIYTQHVHGYAHANKDDTPKAIRALQSIPFFPVFLSPEEHTRHHGRPLGKEAYGVLNGWSNYITDATQFFRLMEIAREKLTGEKPTWEHEKEIRAIAMERKKKGLRSTHDC